MRNRVIFEGPDCSCGVAAAVGFKVLLGATRRLRDRAREGLLVEEDILRKEKYDGTIIT